MKYFTIDELSRSDTAWREGIDNTPSDAAVKNLTALVDNVLDPLREWYGKPVHINSGYRNSETNRLVGGVADSYHLKGMAADIDMGGKADNQPLFDYIREHLPFTELGWEGGGRWIHVAYDPDHLDKEVFFA